METLAAVSLLRDFFPDLKIRVVNVVDLMRFQDEREHPHGLSDAEFDSLFTRNRPVIFACHGYPWLIHRLAYRRTNHTNFHVRGYKEEGATTPFDMTVMNQLDRFNLAMDVIDGDQTMASMTAQRWAGEGDLEPIPSSSRTSTASTRWGTALHGGPRRTEPVLLDDDILTYLDSIGDPAALHNPRALAGIRTVRSLLPDVSAVACCDTTLHAHLPPAARTYALPREWNARWRLRRYGLHGPSHAHAVRRGAELIGGDPGDLRVVSCHLGSGASVAAVRGGDSVDTSMGFTPLEGLVVATRSGSVDPGVCTCVRRVPPQTATRDRCYDGHCWGLDLLVMTGGVGEHEPEVRSSSPKG